MTMIRAVLIRSALAVCAAALAVPSMGQDYPARPIKIISGPGPDIVARIFGRKLTEAWGQQVIAESLPAAGGKVAADTIARAAPDGYTLMNGTSSFQVATALGISPVDLSKDLTAVALTNYTPFVLAVPASLPVNSVQELIALARAKPGQLNYASGGNGTLPHLAAELFKQMAKLDIVHVPYKAADQAGAALISGQVQMMFTAFSVVGPQAKAGKVRPLAMTPLTRSKLAPELPTLSEAGVPGFEILGWNGLVAPPGTPGALVARINAEVQRALRSPDVVQQFAGLGFEAPPPDMSAEQFAEFMRAEAQKWAKLVKDTGSKID
jgi:tripartite-type tricarboxylate transporter receptor subunit TctC